MNRKEQIAERDGLRCRYCLRVAPDVDSLTIEHLVPICRGGSHSLANLGLSCRQCNHDKGPLTEAEYLPVRGDAAARKTLERAINAELPQGPKRQRTVIAHVERAPRKPLAPDPHPHFRWCTRCRAGWHGACLLRCSCPEHDCGKILLTQRIVIPDT